MEKLPGMLVLPQLLCGVGYVLSLWLVCVGFVQANPAMDPAEQLRQSEAGRNSELVQLAGQLLQQTKQSGGMTWPSQVRTDLLSAAIRHPDWLISEALVTRAEQEINLARSGLLPRVSLSADWGKRMTGQNPVSGLPAFNYNSTGMQLGARQLLLDFGATFDSIRSASLRKTGARQKSMQTRSEVALTVAVAMLERQRLLLLQMWEASLAKERRVVEDKSLERFNLGIGTIYDYARTKAKTAEAELNLKVYQSRYQSISAFLAQLGIDEGSVLPPLRVDASVDAVALTSHPLVREAKSRLNALQMDLQAQKGRTKPQVYLDMNANTRSFQTPFEGSSVDRSALLTLTYDIFNGGRDQANLAMLASSIEQAEGELARLELDLKDQMVRLQSEYNANQATLPDLQLTAQMATDVYIASVQLFSYRRGNLNEILRSEDEMSNQMRRLINSWIDASIIGLRFSHTQGRLLRELGIASTDD